MLGRILDLAARIGFGKARLHRLRKDSIASRVLGRARLQSCPTATESSLALAAEVCCGLSTCFPNLFSRAIRIRT